MKSQSFHSFRREVRLSSLGCAIGALLLPLAAQAGNEGPRAPTARIEYGSAPTARIEYGSAPTARSESGNAPTARLLAAADTDKAGAAREAAGTPGSQMAERSGDARALVQTATGLLWSRADNGSDVTWAQAQAFCTSLGPGWSLPTVEQLQSIYNSRLPEVECGTFKCKVPGQFKLTERWFWTSEANGAAESWLVDLHYGFRASRTVGSSGNRRAVCVRKP